jgi:alpha-aminoadipate carrier protein LysW
VRAILPNVSSLTEVMNMALCTECEAEIELNPSTEVGEIIQCPDCGLDLEVISVEPPELAPAPEEEEDWGE